jgi:DNA invertase Pin-like site-specific DNA recombinase
MWRKAAPPSIDWRIEMLCRAAAWAEIEARFDASTRTSRIAGGKEGGILGGRPRNEDLRAVQQAKKMMRAGKSLRAAAAAVGMSAPTLSRRLKLT